MNENAKFWIWMQQALGEGASVSAVIDDFGSAKELYESNIIDWKMSGALVPKQINKLENTKIQVADEIIYNCQQNGWQIITYEDKEYPERLKEIASPPLVLYVDGTFPKVDENVLIGVVGTRKASGYAIKVTDVLSRGISQAGAIVVSGGALGVDTAAHKGAILAKGKTVAVLGCGLGTEYLNENKSLREVIKQNGALVTEFPPFTKASRYTFPMRNRIISGLSLGVLVVEAGVKSGSLITANYALQQNRDVFAVPCSILSPEYAGTNKLIDDGAIVATTPFAILFGYAEMFPSINLDKIKSIDELVKENSDFSPNVKKTKKANVYKFENADSSRDVISKRNEVSNKLSGNQKIVFESLTEKFEHVDLIAEKCGLAPRAVLSALTALEISELAESASGKRYKLS